MFLKKLIVRNIVKGLKLITLIVGGYMLCRKELPRIARTVRPAIASPVDCHQQDFPSQYPATGARLPENELTDNGFVVRDFQGHVTENRFR